jgi:uncharacterized membrane protein YphA (DoxX/SURF4 family)
VPLLRRLGDAWCRFWFAQRDTLVWDIFRIQLGLFWLATLLLSLPNWDRFYAPDGLAPHYPESLSWLALLQHPQQHWLAFWLALGSGLAFTVGLATRFASVLFFFSISGLFHRNYDLINGQDLLSFQLLFFCMFAPMGRQLSLDAWLRPQNQPPAPAEVWTLRLMQIGVMANYLFGGPGKWIDSPTWVDGSALYWVVLSERWFRFPDPPLMTLPAVSWFLTFFTLAVEHLVPILIFIPRFTVVCLLASYLLHLPMLVLMSPGVHFYQVIMLISFTLFWPESWLERLRRRPSVRAASAVLLVLALPLLVGCQPAPGRHESTFVSHPFGGTEGHEISQGRVRRIRPLSTSGDPQTIWLTGFRTAADPAEQNAQVGQSWLWLGDPERHQLVFGQQYAYSESMLMSCAGPDRPMRLPEGYGLPLRGSEFLMLQDSRRSDSGAEFVVHSTLEMRVNEPLRTLHPAALHCYVRSAQPLPRAAQLPPRQVTVGQQPAMPEGPLFSDAYGQAVARRWHHEGHATTLETDVTLLLGHLLPARLVAYDPMTEGPVESLTLLHQPGSFELPLEGSRLSQTGYPDPPTSMPAGGRYLLRVQLGEGSPGPARAELMLYLEQVKEQP